MDDRPVIESRDVPTVPSGSEGSPSAALIEEPPLPLRCASRALGKCVLRTVVLVCMRRLHQPRDQVGLRLPFADGTSAHVYRETTIDRPPPAHPTVLVVSFRLRHVHGERGHALFRIESVLNTILFAGFPGLISKLWLTHDGRGTYRGLYEWDDPRLAVAYARALWWILALVSSRDSIHYAVLPGVRREELLRDATVAERWAGPESGEWWRPVVAGNDPRWSV